MTARFRRRRSAAALVPVLVAVALVASACNVLGSGLTGKTWQLTALTETVPAFQGVVPAEDQPRYTITFNDDGTAAIKADCNDVTATYDTTVGGGLDIVPGASTLAMCPEDSMADAFVAGLAAATSYNVHGATLTMYLGNEGTLEFIAAG